MPRTSNGVKCLVAGGAGFIGSHLVDSLMAKNHQVVVYDNLSLGKKEFLQNHFDSPNFTFIQGDMLETDALKNAMAGIEVVFHLAANSDVIKSARNPSIDLEQGIMATYNLLESMRNANVSKIIFTSSNVVYGEAKISPTAENYGPLLPISFYGAAKLSGEALIAAYSHNFNFQSWIYRFGNIIGSRPTHGVVLDFYKKLKKDPHKLEVLGDGNQSKPYIEVQDCVEGILLGFEKSKESVNLFNLGTQGGVYVKDIANTVVNLMGLENVEIKFAGGERGWPGDVHTVRLDSRKLEFLGWKPKYPSAKEAFMAGAKDIIKELKLQ